MSGRDFNWRDNRSAPRVAIVNRAFARQILHTEQPVGKAFRHGPGANGALVRVIGLVEDGKYESLTEAPRPALFWPMAQQYNATTTLVVKSARSASEVLRQIRRAVATIDGQLPIYGPGSLVSMLSFALFPMQAAAMTLGAFGILALVLAITGIHALWPMRFRAEHARSVCASRSARGRAQCCDLCWGG